MESDAITAHGETAKTEKVLQVVRIVLFEEEHLLDLSACRRAMPFRVAELRAADPDAGSQELIAKAAGVDPKTLRTFLDGGGVSAEKLVDIVERGLALKLADVLRPVEAA